MNNDWCDVTWWRTENFTVPTRPNLMQNSNNSEITTLDAKFDFYLLPFSFVHSLRLHFCQWPANKTIIKDLTTDGFPQCLTRVETKKCVQDFNVVNIACWWRKSFVQVALDIHKMWPVCYCFISFEKIAWLWSLMVAAFVSLGFKRTKTCLLDCLWRELSVLLSRSD